MCRFLKITVVLLLTGIIFFACSKSADPDILADLIRKNKELTMQMNICEEYQEDVMNEYNYYKSEFNKILTGKKKTRIENNGSISLKEREITAEINKLLSDNLEMFDSIKSLVHSNQRYIKLLQSGLISKQDHLSGWNVKNHMNDGLISKYSQNNQQLKELADNFKSMTESIQK